MSLRAHILVYDDDAITGQALGADLGEAGYINVRVANHFEAALEALEDKVPIDLLLADIRVPGGLNGIALARMAALRNPAIKVIFLTGHPIGEAETREAGDWPILQKPVPFKRLLVEIECALITA